MARARLLKPGFFKNELLAELPFEGRLLFAGLWTLADREGRLEERPKRIQAEIFPFDVVDVVGLLDALEQRGFIERYISGAMALIQIAEFSKHQTPHHREPASAYPPVGVHLVESPRPALGQPESGRAVTGNGSDPVTGNGSDSAEPLTRSTPTFCEFPIVGRGSKTWSLSEAQIAEWATDFPNLDVKAEMRKARAWTEANAGRRKTARGMPTFLVNWLSRSVDRRAGSDRRDVVKPSPQWRASPDYQTWECPHAPKCGHTGSCMRLVELEKAKRAS